MSLSIQELEAFKDELEAAGVTGADLRNALMMAASKAEARDESNEQDRLIAAGPKDPALFDGGNRRDHVGITPTEQAEVDRRIKATPSQAETAKLSMMEGWAPGSTRNTASTPPSGAMMFPAALMNPKARASMDADYDKRHAADVERGRVDQERLELGEAAHPWTAGISGGLGAALNPANPGSLAARGALKVLPKAPTFLGRLGRGMKAGGAGGATDGVVVPAMRGEDVTPEGVAASATGGMIGNAAGGAITEGVGRGMNAAARKSPWVNRALDAEPRLANNPRYKEISERPDLLGREPSPTAVRAEMAELAGEDMARADDAFMKAEGDAYGDVEGRFMATRPTVPASPIQRMLKAQRDANTTEVLPTRAEQERFFREGIKPPTKGQSRVKATADMLDDVERSLEINGDGQTYARNALNVRRDVADKAYSGQGDPASQRLSKALNESLHDKELGMGPLIQADERFSGANKRIERFRDLTRTKGDAMDAPAPGAGLDELGNVGVADRRANARFLNRTAEETIPAMNQSKDVLEAMRHPDMGAPTTKAVNDVMDAASLEATAWSSANKVKGTMSELAGRIPIVGSFGVQNSRALLRSAGRKGGKMSDALDRPNPFSMMSLSKKEERKARK